MVSLFSHLGLGDQILLSGAVVQLVSRHGAIRIFCYPHYFKSVCSFFTTTPGVRVVSLPQISGWYGIPPEKSFHDSDRLEQIVRCGVYAGPFGERKDISFPELFYRQLQVPYVERWKSCPLEKAALQVPQLATAHKIFVHDDPLRGYHIKRQIDSKPLYRPPPGHSILAFTNILRSAQEIHCIDSSFYHLVESLSGITAALYYHRYSRRYVPGWHDYRRRYNWNVLA